MSEHTKEPWEASGPEIMGEDTDHVATTWNHNTINPDESIANARRIVACVNALAGIPTERLEEIAVLFEQEGHT